MPSCNVERNSSLSLAIVLIGPPRTEGATKEPAEYIISSSLPASEKSGGGLREGELQ
jgi:hypothetical protein